MKGSNFYDKILNEHKKKLKNVNLKLVGSGKF